MLLAAARASRRLAARLPLAQPRVPFSPFKKFGSFAAGVGCAAFAFCHVAEASDAKKPEAEVGRSAVQALASPTIDNSAALVATSADSLDDDRGARSRSAVYRNVSNPGTSEEFGDRIRDVLEFNMINGLSIQIAQAPLGQGDPATKQFSTAHHFNMGKNETGEDFGTYEFNANLALYKRWILQGKYSSSGPGVQGVIRNMSLDDRLMTQFDFMVSPNADFNMMHPHIIFKGSDYTAEMQYSGRDQVILGTYIQNITDNFAVSADLLHTFQLRKTFLALAARVKNSEETYILKHQPGAQSIVAQYARRIRDSPITLASEYMLSLPDHQSALRGGFMCRFGDNPGLPTARACLDTNLHLQSTLELPLGEQVQLGFCSDVSYSENKYNFGVTVAFQT